MNDEFNREDSNFVICPGCGKKISKLLAFCPNCGNKVVIRPNYVNDSLVETPVNENNKTSKFRNIFVSFLKIAKVFLLFDIISVACYILFIVFLGYLFQGLSYGAEIEDSLIIYIFKNFFVFLLLVPSILVYILVKKLISRLS